MPAVDLVMIILGREYRLVNGRCLTVGISVVAGVLTVVDSGLETQITLRWPLLWCTSPVGVSTT